MAIPVEAGSDNTVLRTVSKRVAKVTPEIRKFAPTFCNPTKWSKTTAPITKPAKWTKYSTETLTDS